MSLKTQLRYHVLLPIYYLKDIVKIILVFTQSYKFLAGKRKKNTHTIKRWPNDDRQCAQTMAFHYKLCLVDPYILLSTI